MLPKPSARAEYFNQMATDLVEINIEAPQPEVLERAAAAVRRGRVVAIPTDALYTLVADPFNLRAVTQVFKAKGREPHRSLPILVSDLMMAEELAGELNKRFYLLARRFWPGPLTVIVPASAKVPLKVTGNTGRLERPPDRYQRQHLRTPHLPERHRCLRHHGRAPGPRARWRRLLGHGRHD